MAAETVVRVRIDREVKEQAAAVLAEIGLPIPGLIRTLLRRVAAEGTVPFEPKCPMRRRSPL